MEYDIFFKNKLVIMIFAQYYLLVMSYNVLDPIEDKLKTFPVLGLYSLSPESQKDLCSNNSSNLTGI